MLIRGRRTVKFRVVPLRALLTSSSYCLAQKYTRARPQFTSRMGDRGVTITIPHGYSKNSLPNKTRTEVNVGMIANNYKIITDQAFLDAHFQELT